MTADGYTSNPPSGGGGGSVAWTDVTGKPSTFPPSAHSQAASTISDSTATGRSVLTAADAAAARTAIGAGTSSLALGATGADAAAGNHGHAIADTSGLQAALDGKSATGHTHTADQVTDLTESVQDTVGAMVVAGANVTATYDDGAGTLTIAATGGGGGTAATIEGGYLTSGDITPGADASWTAIPGLSFPIAAEAGDHVSFSAKCLIDLGTGDPDDFFDPVVLVGGVPVRYASTGGASSAAANEGDPALYPSMNVRFHGSVLDMDLIVESGDLSGGNVTFGLAHKGPGTCKVFAGTNYPLRWRARNDH